MSLDALGLGPLEAEFWRIAFLMTRVMAALLAAPLFGAMGVPMLVRLAASGAIAVFTASWSQVTVPQDLFSFAGFIAVLWEATIGLALGFLLQLAFAAPLIAAEVISGAMGLGMALAADPGSGGQTTSIGQFYTIVLTLVFLGLGGHLVWFRLLVESYDALPPGAAALSPQTFLQVSAFARDAFAAAATIALPIVLALLVMQLLTGVLSRSAPALNLFALGLPAGVLAGIGALMLFLPATIEQMETLSLTALTALQDLLVT